MSFIDDECWAGMEDILPDEEKWSYFDHKTPIWVCKDGTEISIKDMDSNHICNCIVMIGKSITKGNPWRAEWLPILAQELSLRDDKLSNYERYKVLYAKQQYKLYSRNFKKGVLSEDTRTTSTKEISARTRNRIFDSHHKRIPTSTFLNHINQKLVVELCDSLLTEPMVKDAVMRSFFASPRVGVVQDTTLSEDRLDWEGCISISLELYPEAASLLVTEDYHYIAMISEDKKAINVLYTLPYSD